MRILISGGTGFIGSHVVDLLHRNTSNQLFIFDDLSTGKLENIKHLISTKHNTRVKFELSDVCNPAHVDDAMERFKPDSVVLFAGYSGDNPKLGMDVNLGGLLNVIFSAKRYDVRRIVFPSTCGVYREKRWGNLKETDALDPQTPYAISKLAAENYLRNLFPESVVLRLGNVYGPRQTEGILPRAIRHFKLGEEFQIYGDGRRARDYVYVGDVAEAVRCSLTGKPGTYNIGSGYRTSVNSLLNTLAGVYEVPGYAWEHRADTNLRRDVCLNIHRAEESLDWVPRTKLADGLRETQRWWILNSEPEEPRLIKLPIAYEVVR